jgi:integrase
VGQNVGLIFPPPPNEIKVLAMDTELKSEPRMWGRKKKGQHGSLRLSAIAVANRRKPGRYPDGNCLYLEVLPSGLKRWLVRLVIKGRRRDLVLGNIELVTLVAAREIAYDLRRSARKGGDPSAQVRTPSTKPTFKTLVEQVHKANLPTWKNEKHGAQWINTLKQYAYPVIGERQIDDIERPDILNILQPIWLEKPETARRLRQRLRAVFDWAKAHHMRDGDNPVDAVEKALPRQTEDVEHHAALPIDGMQKFLTDLRSRSADASTLLAFEFLILTATRTSEAINARWPEINLADKTWTVPKERMKAGVEHVVPLPARCLAILEEAKRHAGDSAFIFPGRKADKPISNMAFLMLLRRMELNITAHGFRSTFRDWASERTDFQHEVIEMALAHTIKNKVEAAYRRGNLLEKRRELMAAWERFACPPKTVTPLM